MTDSELDVAALERDRHRLLDPLASQVFDLATVILGHAAILATTVPVGDERREDVEAMAVAARRLVGVVGQILAASGPDAPSAELQARFSQP